MSDAVAAASPSSQHRHPCPRRKQGEQGEAGVGMQSWPLYTGAESNLRDMFGVKLKRIPLGFCCRQKGDMAALRPRNCMSHLLGSVEEFFQQWFKDVLVLRSESV